MVFLVVFTDCALSVFGAMGNDASYNAWTNDNTTDQNRGQIAAALALSPVLGTIIGTVVGGMLIGAEDNYQRLFWAIGGLVIIMGVASLLFVKDAPSLVPHKEGGLWRQFAEVFNLKIFLGRRELVLASCVAAVYFISFNVFFVYMGNWLIYHMGFTPDQMGFIQGGGLILAMALAIPTVGLINRQKTPYVAGAAIIVDIIGLWILYVMARPGRVDPHNLVTISNLPLFIGVFLVGAGYVLIMQTVTIWVKQLYPESNRGQFEGVRLTFFTLIPMLIGTLLGNLVVKTGAGTVVNEFGITENIPTEEIFFWAAWIALLAFLPLFFAGKRYYARVRSVSLQGSNDQPLG